MVHYLRFLKTARVKDRTSRTVSVAALITVTTDLGDTFLLSDATLVSCLVAVDEPSTILCKKAVRWHRGSRELSLELNVYADQSAGLLRLHVFHDKASEPIPSILGAWSAPFQAVPGSIAAPSIERQLSLPNLPTLKIWEDIGNSIARHMWDAALGCILCFQDVVSASARMPFLTKLLQRQPPGQINILELGAGCGTVGIALAHSFPNCQVVLTDLAEAQDILSRNMEQATPATNSSLRSRTLDWNGVSEEADLERDLALVIVSDCTYNAGSCPYLVGTLARVAATSPGVKILVAMKRRHDSEDVFFDLMRDAHLQILENETIDLPSELSVLDDRSPEVELYMYGMIEPGWSSSSTVGIRVP